jgi:hypothetical protein
MRKTLIFSGLNTFCRFKAITYDCRRPTYLFSKRFTEINENLENRYLICLKLSHKSPFYSIQGCHPSTLRSTESGPFFHSLCTTKAPFQILCVNFSTQTQMTAPMTLHGSTLPTYIVKCTFNCSYQLDTLTAGLYMIGLL